MSEGMRSDGLSDFMNRCKIAPYVKGNTSYRDHGDLLSLSCDCTGNPQASDRTSAITHEHADRQSCSVPDLFFMDPVFRTAWNDGLQPLLQETIGFEEGFERTLMPFRIFMAGRLDPDTFTSMAELRPDASGLQPGPEAPLSILIPSFLLSEIARAFQIGFLIFLPFLIIDLVVAAVLMSMGMMMVPPAIVSLPFKLAFFVIADGWHILASALVRGYS